MVEIYSFSEHDFAVQGENSDLLRMAELLTEAGAEGTLGDLAFKIRYALDEAFRAEIDKCGGDSNAVSE